MSDKKKYRLVKEFRLDEISLVDKPAHGPARIAIMKRAADTSTVKPIQKKLALTSLTAGHAHSVIMVSADSESLAELRAGNTSYAEGHTHGWVMDDAGNIILADAEGHSHGLSILITKADDSVSDDILAESLLASLVPAPEQASNAAATGGAEIKKMTPEEKAAAEQVAQDQLNELTKSNARLEQIVKLSPDQRTHYEALPTNEQEDFLGNEDKDAVLKNLANADPIVYKSRDGDEFRKSDDQRLVKAAQRADKAEERVEKGEKLAKRAGFEKLAAEELKHLTGDDSAKADLLEGVEALPIEKREAAMAILKSKDAGMEKAFTRVSESGDGEGTDVEAKLNALAKAYGEKHTDLSPEQAYSAALDTPEGQKLHAQQLNG